MTMPYLLILVLVACAVFFYRAAESEGESVWIWCGLSLLISAVTLFWLHWGWLGAFSCQLALFVGITLIRMCREK
jgi:cytochrome b